MLMKGLIFVVFCICLTACSVGKEYFVSSSFYEPATEGLRFIYSSDGVQWSQIPGIWLHPQVGTQKVMRDPSIVKGPNGVYHLVWTTSWKGDVGFGYAYSSDLIHWSEQKHIPVMAFDSSTVNVWAPELFYDDTQQEFIVIWASTIPYKFEKGIEDEYNNHRLYYVRTPDFKQFSEVKLFYDPGFSAIDATVVKRGDNDYVNVFKDNTRPNRNLRVAFGRSPTGPWSVPSEAFTDSFTEGPTVLKNDEHYLIYYDSYQKMIFGAAKTTDFIQFVDITDSISVPAKHKHGTIFKAPKRLVDALLKRAETKTQVSKLNVD